MYIEYYLFALQLAGIGSAVIVTSFYTIVLGLHLLALIYEKTISFSITAYKVVGAHIPQLHHSRQTIVKT